MDEKHQYDSDETMIVSDEIEHGDELEVEEVEIAEAGKIKKLRDSLRECELEKSRCLEDLQRTKADFLNSKRRLEEQFNRDRERITERTLVEFLPLIDSFDTAMQNVAHWESKDPVWRTGIEGIYAQLIGILKRNGIEELEAQNTPFNPHEHEAVANVPVETPEKENTVIAVLQKGFKLNGTIIRPAKVSVGIHTDR